MAGGPGRAPGPRRAGRPRGPRPLPVPPRPGFGARRAALVPRRRPRRRGAAGRLGAARRPAAGRPRRAVGNDAAVAALGGPTATHGLTNTLALVSSVAARRASEGTQKA